MENNDLLELYKDALYWHFISIGYSDWMAKAEADRIVSSKKESSD
jgi:hypothetical protein